MTNDQIRAFAQPTWELYKDVVLSTEGNDGSEVEDKPVYDYYHERVMSGEYDNVCIAFIKDKPLSVEEEIKRLKPQISRYIFSTEDDPDTLEWDDIIYEVSKLVGPILLENELIEEDDLQYYKGQIDWAATLNDVIAMLDDDEKIVFYECILN